MHLIHLIFQCVYIDGGLRCDWRSNFDCSCAIVGIGEVGEVGVIGKIGETGEIGRLLVCRNGIYGDSYGYLHVETSDVVRVTRA